MNTRSGSGVNDLQSTDHRSRRRLVAEAAVIAVTAFGVAKGAADARKRKKKPSTKTVTRTYLNDGQISLPDAGGQATPFPASLTVADMNGGIVRSVTLTLKGVTHSSGREIAVMLAKDAVNAVVMGSAGGTNPVPGVTLVLDDSAESSLPQSAPLVSGRFQPTNYIPRETLPLTFGPPAPLPSGNALLSAFNGIEPNGSWRLYGVDRTIFSGGTISGGWELTITADVPKKKKRKKKKR